MERYLNAFPLRLRTGQGGPPLSFLFNIVLEVLAKAIRQEKEINSVQIVENNIKLFTDDIIIYIENLKELAKKPF